MPAPPVPLASRLAHQSTHLHQRTTDTPPRQTAATPAPPAPATLPKRCAARDPSHARPTETPTRAPAATKTPPIQASSTPSFCLPACSCPQRTRLAGRSPPKEALPSALRPTLPHTNPANSAG